ncbi:hypothetical protein ACH4FE_35920 [Streptomyces celluloflavus]|uniref:hypothetical protein n=1 Tax=Streptomyces celluloflavus TaxID=58344 RepID=UPI003788717A
MPGNGVTVFAADGVRRQVQGSADPCPRAAEAPRTRDRSRDYLLGLLLDPCQGREGFVGSRSGIVDGHEQMLDLGGEGLGRVREVGVEYLGVGPRRRPPALAVRGLTARSAAMFTRASGVLFPQFAAAVLAVPRRRKVCLHLCLS